MSESTTLIQTTREPWADSEAADDDIPAIERSKRRFILLGVLVIVLGFGTLGTWAAIAPLMSAALAPGVVKVAGERKTIQHLEGGIVKEILVKEDMEVQAGQVLVRLDDTMARTRVGQLRGQHDALTATIARFEAERASQARIEFPQALFDRRDDPQVARLIAGEEQVFRARREALTSELDILRQRIVQFEEEIQGLEAQAASTSTQLNLIEEERVAAETLLNKGIYEKPKYLALKRAAARLAGEIGAHRSKIAQIKQQMTETRLRGISLQRQQLKEISDGLKQAQTNLFDIEERMRAAQDALNRIDILAPQAGTVIGLNVHTIGGVIAPGERILDIVPRNDALVVVARIQPEDIDVVHEGAPAEVRLTAFNARNTIPRQGSVTKVSADRLNDKVTGMPFYQIEVTIQDETAHDSQLFPGMSAEVYVVTGQRTALEYLLKPIRDSFRRGLLEE